MTSTTFGVLRHFGALAARVHIHTLTGGRRTGMAAAHPRRSRAGLLTEFSALDPGTTQQLAMLLLDMRLRRFLMTEPMSSAT